MRFKIYSLKNFNYIGDGFVVKFNKLLWDYFINIK